jgi:hypothetical protein
MQRQKAFDAIIYTPALLLIVIWVLVSFFPLAGAGMAWGSWWVLGHLAFLAAGFPGLLTGYFLFRWAFLSDMPTPDPQRFRNRWFALCVYAVVWMTAYGLFVAFVPV